jgi:hydroxyacylglutathione hydrolase
MLLKLLYDPGLAQASWLVGCQATGEALVVDPNRDVAGYLAAARAEGLTIRHVTETHIHADFASGSRELAQATGARLYLSAEGGPDWQYAFAAGSGATLVKDGDRITVGNVRLDVMHTPGHTPEHLAFQLTDGAATDRPMGAFTGDFVFVGDVGRPDLLERAAGMEGTMEAGARQLFASLQRFKRLPDYLQIWPAHGAGSACGKSLGAVPSSTMGYERFANWGFTTEREEDFVRIVLEGQPEPPAYFAIMKRINRDGVPLLGTLADLPHLEPSRLAAALAAGAQVVDLRATRDFAARHVPGTLNIPLSRSFLTYAGTVLDYTRPVVLLARDAAQAAEARADLTRIGFDRVDGWCGPEALEGAAGRTVQEDPAEVAGRLAAGGVVLLDVRGRAELAEGAVAGAVHIPMSELVRRLAEVPAGRPVVCLCESGSRSAVVASLLKARGRADVSNLAGGIAGWRRAGLPLEGAPAPVRA